MRTHPQPIKRGTYGRRSAPPTPSSQKCSTLSPLQQRHPRMATTSKLVQRCAVRVKGHDALVSWLNVAMLSGIQYFIVQIFTVMYRHKCTGVVGCTFHGVGRSKRGRRVQRKRSREAAQAKGGIRQGSPAAARNGRGESVEWEAYNN